MEFGNWGGGACSGKGRIWTPGKNCSFEKNFCGRGLCSAKSKLKVPRPG